MRYLEYKEKGKIQIVKLKQTTAGNFKLELDWG